MKSLSILLISLILSGCGYSVIGFTYEERKIVIKPVINKISITSENRDYSNYVNFPILIETKLTSELIKKFNIDGNLKVVSKKEEALRLICTVNNYTKEALRYENNDDVKEQRLRLNVHIKLISSKEEILQDKGIEGETTYYLSRKSESAAQLDLIKDTARRISEAVLEEW